MLEVIHESKRRSTMKSDSKWCLATLAVVLVLTAGVAPSVMAYQYVESDPDTYEYEDDPEDVYTSTSIEDTSAIPAAQEDGDCACAVATYAWATDGDSAVAIAEAYGAWQKTWEWNGPPGEAPGGTLSWSHWGGGSAHVVGAIYLGTNGGAMSVASADSSTDGSGSGGGSYGTSNAFGYVDTTTSADTYSGTSATGDPEEGFWSDADSDTAYYSYDEEIDWGVYGSDDDSIASGTSYVYFSGGAWCDNFSAAGAGPLGSEAEAGGGSGANASVSLSASFTSN
jgi:hypothetical protein